MKASTVLGIIVSVVIVALGFLLVYSAGVIFGSSAGPVFSWELAIPGIIVVCIGAFFLVWLRIGR